LSNPHDTRESRPRILFLTQEDGEADRVSRRLNEQGLAPRLERVFSLGSFATACAAGSCDVVLIDADLPDTGAWRALKTARRQCSGVPIILLASASGSELAGEIRKHGASDLVDKEHPDALREAILRAVGQGVSAPGVGASIAAAVGDAEAVGRLIAEQTLDVVCLHTPDRVIRFVTPAVLRRLGYAPAEWVERRLPDFLHLEEAGRLQDEIERALAQPDAPRLVVGRFRHKQGHFVWMETKLQAIRSEAGGVVKLLSVSRDCSERMRVEESLRRGERLFEGVAEANRLLLTARKVAETMPAVLRVLGEAAGADRALLCEFRLHPISGRPRCVLAAEWSRETLAPLAGHPELAEMPLHEPEAARELAAGRLPAGLRALFERRGLLRMLQFPVPVHGRAWGVIAFDQEGDADTWAPSVSAALGIVAFNIGQATEREENLAKIADSQRRYEALLAGLSEAVFQVDGEARWRFLNPTWEELTGFRVDESIGRRFSSYVSPDEAPAVVEGFNRLLSGREERIESEIRFLHRLGSEIWLRVAAQPQFDESGRIVGVSGTLVDVTQRRHALEAMRASERKFTAVFEASSDALFLFDSVSNVIVECNPRAVEMFECDGPRDLVGSNGVSLQSDARLTAEHEAGRRRLDRGEVWSDEMLYVTRRGRTFWGLFSIVRMQPESLGTTLLRVTDITDLKSSEERLRASLGEKEVLLKEVYHRVKNNLQIISALLRMQSRRVRDRVAHEALENSISRVMAMSMVHEKLYQAQNLVSIDFLSFAQSLVGFLNQLTVGNQAGVTISVDGDPLALSIDQAIPLGLVLNELVTNSLKYAFPEGRGGRVVISVGSHAPGAARVSVADDGVGLAAGVDLDNSSGLGFRIVHMLVEQLHGELEVEPRNGLKVTVRVPPPIHRVREPGF
jgi:PAS domain S-box-containing protein